MSYDPGSAPAYAIALGQPFKYRLQYTLAEVEWQLQSLSFSLDASGAASSRTAFVVAFTPTFATIVSSYIAVSIPVGSNGVFSLAPDLNPCDSFTTAFGNTVTDTFPALVLTRGCQLRVVAVDALDGSTATDTTLSNGVAWVSDLAGGPSTGLEPLLVPAPLALSGFAGAGGG